MNILEAAKTPELERLLDLYPVTTLKEQWPGEKKSVKKKELTQAGSADAAKAIAEFADDYLSCCKQHVYVYTHEGTLSKLPAIELLQADRVRRIMDTSVVRLLYVIRLEYSVILREPLEEVTLTFLWPVRLDFTKRNLLVRFVILEKSISSYVGDRRYNIAEKGLLDTEILKELEQSTEDSLKLKVVDLHKGIKKIWTDDFVDATHARYRKTHSAAVEEMDAKYHIKKNQPALYKTLQASFLLDISMDVLDVKKTSVSAFWAEPAKGLIGFPRYSENKGDTDDVVRKILRHN